MHKMFFPSLLVMSLVILVMFTEGCTQQIGGERDEHGCLNAAGYSWNSSVGACIREWELNESQRQAAKYAVAPLSFPVTVIGVFEAKCSGCFVVNLQRDSGNFNIILNNWEVVENATGVITSFGECIASGYPIMESYPRMCKAPGTITFVEVIPDEELTYEEYERMEKEKCDISRGHWNNCSSRCVLDNQGNPDSVCPAVCEALCECGGIAGFGCPEGYDCVLPENPDIMDALGYCVPSGENNPSSMPAINDSTITGQICTSETGESMSLGIALKTASESSCVSSASLTDRYSCNSITGTWWIDIDPIEPKQGCNPACVVNVKTGEAEINWRCTGLINPQ